MTTSVWRLGAKTAGTQQGARGQADEAVAAKALAAHRFQQKAVAWPSPLGVRQLEVQRQGGFQVGKRFGHQGDAVVAGTRQALKFQLGNHGAGFLARGKRPLHGKKWGRCGSFITAARAGRATVYPRAPGAL